MFHQIKEKMTMMMRNVRDRGGGWRAHAESGAMEVNNNGGMHQSG